MVRGTTIQEEVEAALDRDIVLHDALARGVLKYNAVATWLKTNRGLEGDVEEIARAVRRYEASTREEGFNHARDALNRAVTKRNGLVSVFVTQRSREAHDRIPEVFELVELSNHEQVHFVSTKKHFTLIVPQPRREEVRNLLGEEIIVPPIENFREITVEAGGRKGSPGASVLSILVSCLTARGISVPFGMNGVNEQILLVQEEDYDEAFAVIHDTLNVDR